MRAQRQLLEHASSPMYAASLITAGYLAKRLHMEMLLQTRVDIVKHDVFTLDREVAVVQSVAPFRVAVSETQHEEIVDRCECRFESLRIFAQ